MLTLRPEYDSSEYQHGRAPDGRSAVDGPRISVEAHPDGEQLVCLNLEPHVGETIDDRDIDRNLTPDEARALAAVLRHYADEVERPR